MCQDKISEFEPPPDNNFLKVEWNMLVWNIYQENIVSEDFCKEIYDIGFLQGNYL